MQSTENVSLTDTGDKSLEWPTLNDVCINGKKSSPSSSSANNSRDYRRRIKSSPVKSGGYDSSKENEVSPQSANGRGARKKSSIKTKWLPVPIVPQPYKKRGFGRQIYDSNRSFNSDRSNEFSNGQENGRGGVRGNNRFRGKRGRGYSHNWRPRREETSRGEIENGTADLTLEAECYYNNAVYYDPFMHNVYASALRDKDLKTAIRLQIEYYFSDENLDKDIFMRRKMDSQGYVPLTLISTFHRVKNLTKDTDTIIESLKDSSKLELVENAKVRPVVDPLKWPLADVGLRTDVPEFFPGQPYITPLIEGVENMNFNVSNVNGDKPHITPLIEVENMNFNVNNVNGDKPYITPLIEGVENMNFNVHNVNGDKYPQSPDSACLSTDQASGDFITDGEQSNNGSPYPESASPPEHILSSANFITDNSNEPYGANGCDFYPHTPSPGEHVNGFDYYKQIANGVIYCTTDDTNDQITNRMPKFYYGSSPDLSNDTDNSVDDQKDVLENISPEPAR